MVVFLQDCVTPFHLKLGGSYICSDSIGPTAPSFLLSQHLCSYFPVSVCSSRKGSTVGGWGGAVLLQQCRTDPHMCNSSEIAQIC